MKPTDLVNALLGHCLDKLNSEDITEFLRKTHKLLEYRKHRRIGQAAENALRHIEAAIQAIVYRHLENQSDLRDTLVKELTKSAHDAIRTMERQCVAVLIQELQEGSEFVRLKASAQEKRRKQIEEDDFLHDWNP